MQNEKSGACGSRNVVFTGAVLLLWLLTTPILSPAQCSGSQGNNAVYANCGGGTIAPNGSPAFIDASALGSRFSSRTSRNNGLCKSSLSTRKRWKRLGGWQAV
jgi:hypothetical protein